VALVYTDQFLHRRYAKPGKIECLAVHDKPILDMLKKGKHSGSGKTFHEPVRISNPQGLSATRATTQVVSAGTHAGATSVVAEWNLPYGDYTGGVEITDKDIDAGGDVPDGSYLSPIGLETDGVIDEFGEVMDTYLFSEPGKAVGSYSGASLSTGVMTLIGNAAETQIMNFNIGAAFQTADGDGSGANTLLGSGSIGYVIAVNYDALTVTFSATPGGAAGNPTSWTTAGTNFVFKNGDFQGTGGGNAPVFIIDSFADWIPAAAPGSTPFKGVDRSVDSRLGGARLTSTQASGLSNEERIKRLVTKLNSTFGGSGEKLVVLESTQWQKLASVLEARGQRPLEGKTANMSYQYITLQTGKGMCKVVASPKCRPDTFWALEMDKWTLRTLSGFPKVMKGDGFTMLRKATSDKYEFRIACYGHLSTPYPSRQGRGPIDTTQ
jgi:hypothetical protein